MKPQPDCVPCLLKRVLFQARLLEDGSEEEAVSAALKNYAAGYDGATNSAKLATDVHKAAYEAMGWRDPYTELKVRADAVASKYVDRLDAFVDSVEDRFAAAVRVSIIGNVMDFGSGISIDDPGEFDGQFDRLLEQGIDSDQTAELKKLVEGSESIVYMFDNCGEGIFDIILMREIRRMGKRVVGVVRGAPILNDITAEDALRAGLDREMDLMLTSNAFSIGVNPDLIGDDLLKEIASAGVVIAKGMANYESLSDADIGTPIAFLLRAKCRPVASSLGVPVGANVVRIIGHP